MRKMPKLRMDAFDMSMLPTGINHKYASMLRDRDRGYFWLLFLFGCVLFLISMVF